MAKIKYYVRTKSTIHINIPRDDHEGLEVNYLRERLYHGTLNFFREHYYDPTVILGRSEHNELEGKIIFDNEEQASEEDYRKFYHYFRRYRRVQYDQGSKRYIKEYRYCKKHGIILGD